MNYFYFENSYCGLNHEFEFQDMLYYCEKMLKNLIHTGALHRS